MPNRVPWIERKFSFDFPVDLFPELMERLGGTPARLEEVARSLPATVLTRRDDQPWSIQENIAHIADVEKIFLDRLGDYDAGLEVLRPADMTNRRTHEADHNSRSIDDVLDGCRATRGELIAKLEALEPADFGRSAMHPRLEMPMRTVDMLFFIAEHDDYHLARIRELMGMFGQE